MLTITKRVLTQALKEKLENRFAIKTEGIWNETAC